jgi:hypothetical protein
MRPCLLWVLLALLPVSGCGQWIGAPCPDVTDVEKRQVSACEMVGMVSETADAGNPFAFEAEAKMILEVRRRAAALGASHIVWLHRTATSAAAEAYRCPAAR